jgi:hypothetical protein
MELEHGAWKKQPTAALFWPGMQSRRQKRNFCSPPHHGCCSCRRKPNPVRKEREAWQCLGVWDARNLGKRDGTPEAALHQFPAQLHEAGTRDESADGWGVTTSCTFN